MCKVLIFGGTTEGRILAEYCSENGIPAFVSVMSEYGKGLLKEDFCVKPVTGAMDAGQMKAWMEEKKIELVVDATHPYAKKVTENIKTACRDTQTRYLRCLRKRENGQKEAGDASFSTPEKAAGWLEATQGNIFITTGSNELEVFARSEKLRNRIFTRVLPSSSVIRKCEELGIAGCRLFCMQGPFTKEMNAALLRQTDAAFLVTKETGKAGGFEEKLRAAAECGVSVIVIGRPEEEGEPLSRIMDELVSFSVSGMPQGKRAVSLAGIGPGSLNLMTAEVRTAILNSDFLIGAPRMLETAASLWTGDQGERHLPQTAAAYLDQEVEEALQLHKNWRRSVVLYSGDSGFYSGTRKLAQRLKKNGYDFKILPGISSVSYFASRLGTSWDDALLQTAHGRDFDAVSALKTGRRKIFLLTGGANGAGQICRSLAENGFGHVKVTVGERLSYPEERITSETAQELSGRIFEPLSLILIEDENNER